MPHSYAVANSLIQTPNAIVLQTIFARGPAFWLNKIVSQFELLDNRG
jgi:hypothetical protein